VGEKRRGLSKRGTRPPRGKIIYYSSRQEKDRARVAKRKDVGDNVPNEGNRESCHIRKLKGGQKENGEKNGKG